MQGAHNYQPHSHHDHSHDSHDNHQHSHHDHHHSCSHSQHHQIDPQQYFQQLSQLKQKNRQFYWMQIVQGKVLAKYLQKYGLQFINTFNIKCLQHFVIMLQMMITCDWLPLLVRPFITGMFFPLLLYIFLQYKIITGFDNQTDNLTQQQQLSRQANPIITFLPIILYILIALRTSGKVPTSQNKKAVKKILQIRPYLQNPNLMCSACQLPRCFRSMHCPLCKICIPKFSSHSTIFGICIGAANQLLIILFFLSMTVFSTYFLFKFTILHSLFGFITQTIQYIFNISILWMSFVQFSTLVIINLYYGLTQFQLQNWRMHQYLLNIPIPQFSNPFQFGIIHVIIEDLYALLGISGFQSKLTCNQNLSQQHQPLKQQITDSATTLSLNYPQIKQNIHYKINWNKAYIYVLPQLPNHPKRNQISQLMKIQQPKMIQNYRLLKKYKKQIQQQNPSYNQFQIQQYAMIKMQQYHQKNNTTNFNTIKPPPQQQKIMQLHLINQMKIQFKYDNEIFNNFQDIQNKLKSGNINPDEAALGLRALQQKVMQMKMQQMMKTQQQQSQSQNSPPKTFQKQQKISKQIPILSPPQTKSQKHDQQQIKQSPQKQQNPTKKTIKQQQQYQLTNETITNDENL